MSNKADKTVMGLSHAMSASITEINRVI